ncbi:PREDICTED: integrin alpha-M-like [Nanorana parkeri]|uniref:integrin alpha-M-like n=1 Tax=Nanorana parkeri TaxID=125878 RepID=UPI00085505AC|nr:PREDICTED: integrin alpha-M-like [Nanorana parkeri]
MMMTPLSWILFSLVLSSAGAFFMDTKGPIVFQNGDLSFGHQVVQLDKSVIVSAPLQQTAVNKTGQLFRCDPQERKCSPIEISTGSDDGINISLGLSLAVQDNSAQLLACGSTLQRVCGENIYVNGRCYQVDLKRPQPRRALPAFLPECNLFSLDIVFLIDGSGSVATQDFTKMLTFVSRVMTSFSKTDTQFALMQYSSNFIIHFDFNKFASVKDPAVLTSNIKKMQHLTRTATAIHKVTTELFVPSSGARDKAVKLLIVITDGQTNGDDRDLQDSANEARGRGIVGFAIGVGGAFRSTDAYAELQTIASSRDRIFQVTDFSALSQFQKTLQEKIFAIEGTQSQDATSFQMEMSQEGFSAILTQDGPILGAVGAYGWSGGVSVYTAGQQNGTWINATKDQTDMRDSYMGYAVQNVAKDKIAVGAPRYQHTGKVLIYTKDPRSSQWRHMATANGEQIGSYFGSVLSVLQNSQQPVLVVGAPTYYSPEVPSGRVYLCPIPTQVTGPQPITISCPVTLHGDSNQAVGQFGSAITVLPDLTGDQLPDLAVGAPYEDNYQGAVYIFPGQGNSFRTSYIQRVTGSLVGSGIRFFGRSVSGNLDMTGDTIPDVTVGGEGRVIILKSRPVVGLSVSMTFNPQKIQLDSYECSVQQRKELATNVTLCFTQEVKSTQVTGEISARVNYTLLLDSAVTSTRAVFSKQPDTQTASRLMDLKVGQNCAKHPILLPGCVEDSLTPLRVSLSYSLMGNPVLSEDSRTSHAEEVPFQKNCGGDDVCEDDLRLAINFASVTQLVVGTLLDINVTVSVESLKDDSYNTRVLLPFPVGLSYRRVSLIESNKKVTVLCTTLEGQRVVNCAVNRPLLRPNTTVVFLVGFHVSSTSVLGDSLLMVANITSDNTDSAINRRMSSTRVDVLYAIYVTITGLEESSKYHNFTSDDSTIQHIYRVNNLGQRSLPLSVVFLLPVRLGEVSVWEKITIISSEPEITNCTMTGVTEGAKNVGELIKKSPIVNCSVGWCVRAECQIRVLEPQSSVILRVNGSVTKDWTTQTEQKKISLQSWAEIVYDNRTFHQNQQFTRAQAQTVLEIPTEYNYLPIIVGSSVGGLVLLALITAALYKLGFFKRQYKDMLDNTAEGEMGNDNAPLGPENVGETG